MRHLRRRNSFVAFWGWRTFAAVLMLLFLVDVPALWAQQPLPPTLAALFEKGVKALKQNRLEEAEQCFQEVLRQGGKQAFVYNNLGIVYQRRGDHQQAVGQFRTAIRVDPEYASPRILLGASLLALGEVPEAISQLQDAVKLEPHEPLAHLALANALERAGNMIEMVEEYRALKQMSPDNPEYVYQLGRAYQKLAAWSLGELGRRNPASARVPQAQAEIYQARGEIDRAIRFYERAAELDQKLPGIHLALARIYLQQEKLDQARKEVQEELAIVPDSASARMLAKKLAQTGDSH